MVYNDLENMLNEYNWIMDLRFQKDTADLGVIWHWH